MNNLDFLEGVNIIGRHIPEDQKKGYNIIPEHDQIFFGAEKWVTNTEDRKRLEELGWFIENDSWTCFT